MCLELGAENVGFVEIERNAIANQRADILAALPSTKTLIEAISS